MTGKRGFGSAGSPLFESGGSSGACARVLDLWSAVAVYAVLANGAFTLGPVIDVWLRRRQSDRLTVVGPAMLRYGFAFSVGLTLLPSAVAAIGCGVRLLTLLL